MCSLQRDQIIISSLQAFSNSALGKNTLHQNETLRALRRYADASRTDTLSLCPLGKFFNLSKSLLSLYSVQILKSVSNHPAERTAPSERPQTPLQIHQKARSARLRADYPWGIATNYPQRTHSHKPNGYTRKPAFRSTRMSCSSASCCQRKAKEANSVHLSPSLLDLQVIFNSFV